MIAKQTRRTKIKDIALEMGDAPFGSLLKNTDYSDGGALVVQGKNIQGRKCDWQDRRYVSIEKFNQLKRSHCQLGDIVFPKVGTIGKVGILTKADSIDKYVLSTNTMRLRVDPLLADADFIYYLFSSPVVSEHIKSINANSVQPVFNFTSLKEYTIDLPPLELQRNIGEILSSIDDKIELNRQMNRTLEDMARALFKSWFIDFDPVRAKAKGQPTGFVDEIEALFPDRLVMGDGKPIPSGWSIGSLSQYMDVNPVRRLRVGTMAPYLDMKNMPVVGHCPDQWSSRQVGSGTKFTNGDTLLARITPCLENGKTAYVDFLDKEQVGWGSTEYLVLRSKEPLPLEVGYLLARDPSFREHAIKSMSGSSGRQRVPAEAISRYQFVCPTLQVSRVFGYLVKPYFDQCKSNASENRLLCDWRDSLLPRLLSGEIEVADAEKEVAAL